MAFNFKIGDMVILRRYEEVENHYSIIEPVWREFEGRTLVIEEVDTCGTTTFHLKEDSNNFNWPYYAFAPAEDHLIIIRSNGAETFAIEKKNGKEVRRAIAKCSPEDEYKWEIGRDLAFSRLISEKEESYYNGRVVCIDNIGNEANYTVGKIYEFKNGQIISNTGRVIPPDSKVTSFKTWCDYSLSKWIEIVD